MPDGRCRIEGIRVVLIEGKALEKAGLRRRRSNESSIDAAHPRPAQAVEHRYFGGLSNEEIAEIMDVSLATVERDFKLARAFLSREWGGE